MDNNIIINEIILKLENGDTISPFLFLGENEELLNSQVTDICLEILSNFNIPISYLFKLRDDNEKIKIDNLKKFLEKSNLKPSYKCQIFLIEDIGRFTLSSGNTCLKFFEEPGKGNIIFLTNASENQILDTILSRVTIINTGNIKKYYNKNELYYSLIDNFINNLDYSIFSYFFNEKLTKEEYILFLENIIYFSKKKNIYINILSDLENDLNSIKNNNISAKFIVDKVLIEINTLYSMNAI